MKIDRLLSIIVLLLSRDTVSAREMAERFGVTQRTIQRDMDAIGLAGIPVYALQGPHGGYGILESFKMDRHLVTADDLYFIITSLRSVADSLGEGEDHGGLDITLEKMRSLMPAGSDSDISSAMKERLNIDFSLLGGDPRNRGSFRAVRHAVDAGRVIVFTYTNNRGETLRRCVEPMTLAFKWRSWYLYGWCRNRKDYRLFRVSRIRNVEVSDEPFRRRSRGFDEFIAGQNPEGGGKHIDVVLRFSPELRHIAEDHYREFTEEADGSIVCRSRMPDDGWLYGYILSWGPFVKVLEPESLRLKLMEAAEKIIGIYR